MSDDLRRAYLLGDGHSLYGNLPGTNPEPSTHDGQLGHVFAAMPRPFKNNDQNPHGRPGGRPPYMSNRPLKMDGGLNLQEKTWSGATYMLAPCPKLTDPQDVKSMVLEHAIDSIRSGNGKWKNKIDCLVNHFNQNLILTSATLMLEDFNNYESGLYNYVYLSAQNAAHRAINVPNQGAAGEANFRTSVRYIAAEMTIDARQRYAAPGQPDAQLIPGADTKVVLFCLPIGPAGSLHDAITMDMIREVRQVVTVCKYLQGTLQFGMLDRDQFSQDRVNSWIEDVKQQTKYEVVAKLMRPAFVGKGIIETPVTRLVQCQQRGTNEKGKTTAATITEHYVKFTAIVQQLNPTIPFPVNLPTTFFNSLTSHMQDKLNRRQYRLPPPGSNQLQLEQLRQLRDIATEEEKDIETQIQLIKSTLHPPSAVRPFNQYGTRPPYRPTTRTLMATLGQGDSAGTGQEWEAGYPPGTGIPSEASNGDEDPLMEQFNLLQHCMAETPWTNAAACYLSPAETALRKASGTDRPIECWGCTGHGVHHANRFHSFRDCPNKYDPDVRATAFRRMKQLRQEWEGRKSEQGVGDNNARKREAQAMLSKANATSDWRDLGFTSRKDAERAADAVAMMVVDISARNRKQMCKDWARKWEQGPQENQTETPVPGYYGPTETEGQHQAYHFIAWSFQATPIRSIPLEISTTLPHFNVPIGPMHGKGKLKVAVDSCAGVNIGHLAFHRAMAETFPELVASFKTMQEYGESNVTIGGVEVSAAALKLTHIIEYHTPFRYNGAPYNLTFGLSEQAAATAIISINFLRKTKALWSYDDSKPNVHLTIWNTTLRIQYEAPTRRPIPTPQDRLRAETTAVYTAHLEHNQGTANALAE